MEFRVLSNTSWVPDSGNDTVYLKIDHWNDYSFITTFHMALHDKDGQPHDIGEIKIGFKGQTEETDTHTVLPKRFTDLGEEFFSLGQSVDFYKNMAHLPSEFSNQILIALRDIVIQPGIIEDIKEEQVFSSSLLRDTSLSVIKGQYNRVLTGYAELTNFNFKFIRPETERFASIELGFNVDRESSLNSNIHAVIGHNGAGKTTLLNGMIEAITDRQGANAMFVDTGGWKPNKIPNDYFSSLVSVSFSAFDPFTPPKEQPDAAKGTCYFYIGLKDPDNTDHQRSVIELQDDCVRDLINCFYEEKKTQRWLNALSKLGTDENFSLKGLEHLETIYRDLRENTDADEQSDSSGFQAKYQKLVTPLFDQMSSGHAVVLLTITRLVAAVEEKTLVLLDEPESHLHPPLLSAFVRALADLLHDQNGVAIIATHSPVVLQEIPRCCVWKIYRKGESVMTSRPDIETFAENVGVLTSEVFKLEVERSGFHDILAKSVETSRTYEEIVADYDNQLGFEGRAILMALIANRDRGSSHDSTE